MLCACEPPARVCRLSASDSTPSPGRIRAERTPEEPRCCCRRADSRACPPAALSLSSQDCKPSLGHI
ncbi:hypothetical protein Z043_114948, partial [Scleropages formosus]